MLSVTVVQEASALDPAANRARLHELVPSDSDLVVLPEAYARDFGEAGSDVSPFAESQHGAFATELAAVAAEHNTTVVAGMFETSEDPARPYNTLLVRGAATASYRKIHLYDSFGYKESDSLHAGPLTPVVVEVGGFRVGLMTCYDLRFPELARLLVEHGAEVLVVPAAWVAGPRKVEHWRTLARARAIENTVFVVASRPASPDRATRATRWSWIRAVTCWPRPVREPRCCAPPSTGACWTRPAAPTPRSPTGEFHSPLCNLFCRAPDRPSTSRDAPRAGQGPVPRRRAGGDAGPQAGRRSGTGARGDRPRPRRRARRARADGLGPRPGAGPEQASRRPVGPGRRRRARRPGGGHGPEGAELARRRRSGRGRDGVLLGSRGPDGWPPGRLRRTGPGAGPAGAAARPGLPADRRRSDDLRGLGGPRCDGYDACSALHPGRPRVRGRGDRRGHRGDGHDRLRPCGLGGPVRVRHPRPGDGGRVRRGLPARGGSARAGPARPGGGGDLRCPARGDAAVRRDAAPLRLPGPGRPPAGRRPWSRNHLGAFPRPIEAVLGVPALAWGCHMRARRRQGWWLCAF